MSLEPRLLKRIRVMHLVNSMGVAGAETALYYYIRALGAEEYDHYVYYLGNDGATRDKIEALGAKVHKGKKRGLLKNPFSFILKYTALIIDLLGFIKKKRIQVILSQTDRPNQLAVIIAKLSGRAVFPTVHSTMAFKDKRNLLNLRVHLNAVVNRIIYRLADRVVAVSSEIKDIISIDLRLDKKKIAVLNNGIVIDNDPVKAYDFRKIFAGAENKFTLIAVGRLVPLKGFDILVRAVAEVLEQNRNDFVLAIVGRGQERIRLEKLINDLNVSENVKLMGLRHDVMELLKGSDVFIMPSLYEGLSIAMIEALACGLPIIASDAPGIRDHVKNDQNGILFPIGDHKALSACILKILNNKKLLEKLSRNAKKSFEQQYNMRKNINTLENLFRKYVQIN
jgi:glycosyltransferase involved in cell wall biosynthesis